MANDLLLGLKPEDLKYYLFPERGLDHSYRRLHDETFKTWLETWAEAREELGVKPDLPSDGFTRQTKIGAVFHDMKCIALSGFNELDFSFSSARKDSLLSSWSDSDYGPLTEFGSKVMIGGYLTVAKEYRGPLIGGKKLKDVMVALCVRTLLDSNCDVMTGTMRCNRGTDKSAYLNGATFLAKGSMFDVEVDKVGFFRKHISENFEKYQDNWAENLWSRRIDLTKGHAGVEIKAAA